MLQFRAHPHTLHFKRPAATSRGALVERRLFIVEVFDTGFPQCIGRGEAGTLPGLSIDDRPDYAECIANAIDAINAASLPLPAKLPDPLAEVTALLSPFDSLLAPLPSLRFAIESALLDLIQSGRGILFPSAFTNGTWGLPTHGLIWMASPANILEQIDAKMQAGFAVIKMKIGALPWSDELSLLHEIRLRHPGVTLRLDANRAFDAVSVQPILDDLAPLDIHYLEEPIRVTSFAHAAELYASSPVPIGLDETLLSAVEDWTLARLLEEIRPQHVILKPSLLGGFSRTLGAIAVCEQLGIQWWLNSLLESAIGHAAISQFAALLEANNPTPRVHGIGTGSLFADNFSSPITLQGNHLWWQGA